MKKLIAAILCCFLLTACGQPQTNTPTEDPTDPPIVTDPATGDETQDITEPDGTEPEVTDPEEDPTVNGNPRFIVYTIDENLEHFVENWVEVEEVTADTVVEKLVEAGVLTADITVNSLELRDNAMAIDFSSGLADLVNTMGTSGERALMGSIVNTFISAYGVDSVYITVDGEILESGHVIYDMAMEFFE